ncbi:hypothetical protein IFM89_015805 [Coptis chinensis]|uniref:Plant heme peroxidase family profile domain-containing protein n=1 Tax=Coptis chinensis TaxID=261450 RepID=A0A835IST0_9MAGN|nr:hypothetical protein IFM89_015805 [Coptis chinensis]
MHCHYSTKISCFVLFFIFHCVISCGECNLVRNFYAKSCPQVENIVRNITWNRAASHPTLPPKWLRIQFHDCFVKGCEASLLLDGLGHGVEVEKDDCNNFSLVDGYDIYDEIKVKIEKQCPQTVSCADIIALVARDSISYQLLRRMCEPNFEKTVFFDPITSFKFDNAYYKLLKQNMGMLTTDAALLQDERAISVVDELLLDNELFLKEFGKSMVKLATIGVLTGEDGEIRKNCRSVNKNT